MKVLLLDIETSPNVVHAWGLWNQNIGINQIIEPSRVLCWAAKWHGQEQIMFDSVYQSPPEVMLKGIYDLIGEADVIVHYNGKSFDIPVLNRDFILSGFTPPQPHEDVDLLSVVRKRFKFPSNKLAYVVKALGLGEKTSHEGHELWVKCMKNEPAAWGRMEEYNKNDIVLLERLYNTVKGWVKNHPNHGLYIQSLGHVCPNCGSGNVHPRGFRRTRTKIYQRYICHEPNCGAWSSARLSEKLDDKGVLK